MSVLFNANARRGDEPRRSEDRRRRRLRPTLLALEDRRLLATFSVTSTLDDNSAGTLRWAIGQANANNGADTIDFDSSAFSTPQTITLAGTQLELSDTTGATTIAGSQAGVTISGGGTSRVFQIDEGASASFTDLTISGGQADADGGGILNQGTTALIRCTVSGNTAGLGFGATDPGRGGGIHNSGTLSVSNSTIANNQARYAFFFDGSSGYYSFLPGYGGGIFSSGAVTVAGSTITGNSSGYGPGAGIDNSGGTATLANTIVAGNSYPDLSGPVSGTFNLIGVDESSGLVDGVDGNLVGVADPRLGTLGNYGGPTQTVPLLPGSPAINAGTSAGASATDQRGLGRVGAVDIGAFESQGFTFTAVAGSTPQSAAIGAAFANPLAVSVTANNPVEPVDGVVFTFVANPATNGASAILLGSSAAVAGGVAGVTGGPNNVDGSYTVTASSPGLPSITFALTNTGPSFTTLVVNTTSGSFFGGAGRLSLPYAVMLANEGLTGAADITFDPAVFTSFQTITLAGAQLELSNTSEGMSITGPAAGVAVSAGGLSRVFQVDPGVTASISGLTVTGGSVSYDNGGGVTNFGTLTLTGCTLSGNTASGYFDGGFGGGLFNGGNATLVNCTVSGNQGTGSYFEGGGGGIANGSRFSVGLGLRSTLTLTGCTLSGNFANAGGGLYNAGIATLTGCTVNGNTASYYDGGGVRNGSFANPRARITLSDCTISGNHADGFSGSGGGLSSSATATLDNCTVSGNSTTGWGGGLLSTATTFNGLAEGTLTLTDCRISGNSAGQGGGIGTRGGIIALFLYDGTVLVRVKAATTILNNCTVSGNSAAGDGGGLATGGAGTTTATSTTISGNSAVNGGGLSTSGQLFFGSTFDGTTSLTNCTVSGNSASGSGGGLDNAALSSTTLTGTNVKNNTAADGGGLANQGTLNVASSNILNNTATSRGGGLSTTGGTASIVDSVINSNTVSALLGTARGGGIYAEDSTLSLTSTTVNANRAVGANAYGGGIYALYSAVSLTDTTVNGNWANGSIVGEGGGIASEDCDLTLVRSKAKGNKATTGFQDLFRAS